MKFCGEIAYERKDVGGVHSDICWNCNPKADDQTISDNHRKFLHNCLDEWLDNSNGTGGFWIGDPDYFKEW